MRIYSKDTTITREASGVVHPQMSDELARGWQIIAFATRADGYIFYLCIHSARPKDKPVIFAGCRRAYTLGQFRHHANRYGSRGKRKETRAILDLFACYALKWSGR